MADPRALNGHFESAPRYAPPTLYWSQLPRGTAPPGPTRGDDKAQRDKRLLRKAEKARAAEGSNAPTRGEKVRRPSL